MNLTNKQAIVLKAIENFFSRHKEMPTIRELKEECKNLGLVTRSPRSISLFLEKLEREKYIKRTGETRGIILLKSGQEKTKGLVNVPIFGIANAGSPTLVAEQQIQGYLKISEELIKNKKTFAIKVSGSSMNLAIVAGKKINSGDYIIINAEDKNFKDNDRVLVTVDGLATIKKLKIIDNNKYGLFPESSDASHVPIFITKDDVAIINGKVIDVFPASKDFLDDGDEPVYEDIIYN